MKYGDDDYKAALRNPSNAIEYALRLSGEDGQYDDDAMDFLRAWKDGTAFGALEWGEFRYWVTGVHEPERVVE